MKELTKKHQISAWSIPEVRMVLRNLITEAQYKMRLEFAGVSVNQQIIINAMILYLDSLPPEDRARALAGGVARLEELVGGKVSERKADVPASGYARPLSVTNMDPRPSELDPKRQNQGPKPTHAPEEVG